LVVVVEDEKHGTILRELGDKIAHPRLERRFLYNLTLPETVILEKAHVSSNGSSTRVVNATHITMLWDICRVTMFLVLIHNEMAGFLNFLAILPSVETPPEFGNDCVVTLPGLKVKGTPDALLLDPERSHTLK
jgi:hypothetical protein